MQDLSSYNAAAFLTDGMKAGPQFVRVMKGPKTGTIGLVTEIKTKFYSAHEYKVSVSGRRPFWAKGADLEYLAGYDGETKYINDEAYQVTHSDMMGRTLEVGQALLFHRSADGAPVEMVIGTIKRISKSGAVYAKIFKAARTIELPTQFVKVGRPDSSLVLDKTTPDQIMLAKLSMM